MSNAQSAPIKPSSHRRPNLPWLLYLALTVTGIAAGVVIWKSNEAASHLQAEVDRLTADGERLNLQVNDFKLQEANSPQPKNSPSFGRHNCLIFIASIELLTTSPPTLPNSSLIPAD